MAFTGEASLERAEVRTLRRLAGRGWLLAVLVLAIAAVPKLLFLHYSIFGNDEALLLVYPEQIMGGRQPNRDFFTVYGPGNYLLLSGVYAALGPSLVAERLVGLAYQVALVAGILGLTHRHGELAWIAAGLVPCLLLSGPNLAALSWMGGLAMTVWALLMLRRDGGRAAVAAGVLLGLTTFWRIEMGVLALAVIPLLWGDPRLRRFTAGACLGALPTMAHLAVSRQEVLKNVFLDRVGVNARMDWSIVPGSVLVFAALLVLATAVLVGSAVVRRDRASMSTAMLAVLMLPQAFQRIDYVHVVVMTGSVVYSLALASVLPRRALPHRRAVAGCLVAAMASLTLVAVSTPREAGRVEHAGRSLYVNGAAEVEAAIDSVTRNVPAGSRVFMGSTDMSKPTANTMFLYHLLPEYRSDFHFLELHVGVAERAGSQLVADIESADALVLTDYQQANRLWYPHFPAGAADANDAVAAGFCPVERLAGATLYLAC